MKLEVVGLVKSSFSTLFKNRTVRALALAAALLSTIFGIVIGAAGTLNLVSSTATYGQSVNSIITATMNRLVSLVIIAVVGAILVSLIILLLNGAVISSVKSQGQEGIGAALGASRSKYLRFLGTSIFVGMIAGAITMPLLLPIVPLLTTVLASSFSASPSFSSAAGLILIELLLTVILAPISIYFGIRLSMAFPAIILGSDGIVDSVKKSWYLTKNSFWGIFGASALVGVVFIIITFVVRAIGTLASVGLELILLPLGVGYAGTVALSLIPTLISSFFTSFLAMLFVILSALLYQKLTQQQIVLPERGISNAKLVLIVVALFTVEAIVAGVFSAAAIPKLVATYSNLLGEYSNLTAFNTTRYYTTTTSTILPATVLSNPTYLYAIGFSTPSIQDPSGQDQIFIINTTTFDVVGSLPLGRTQYSVNGGVIARGQMYIEGFFNPTLTVANLSTGMISNINAGTSFNYFYPALDKQKLYITTDNSILVIDTPSSSLKKTIALQPLGRDVWVMSIVKNSPYAYAYSQSTSSLYVINMTSDQISTTLPYNPSSYPMQFFMTPNTKKLYITQFYNATIIVLNGTTNKVIKYVPISSPPYEAVMTPDGKTIFVGLLSHILAISTATDQIVATFNVSPYGSETLAITPDGKQLYAAGALTSDITVVNTTSEKISETIDFGHQTFSLQMNPNGRQVYAFDGKGNVSVINTANNTIRKIDVVANQIFLFLPSPLGDEAYILSNQGSYNSSIIFVNGTVAHVDKVLALGPIFDIEMLNSTTQSENT